MSTFWHIFINLLHRFQLNNVCKIHFCQIHQLLTVIVQRKWMRRVWLLVVRTVPRHRRGMHLRNPNGRRGWRRTNRQKKRLWEMVQVNLCQQSLRDQAVLSSGHTPSVALLHTVSNSSAAIRVWRRQKALSIYTEKSKPEWLHSCCS